MPADPAATSEATNLSIGVRDWKRIATERAVISCHTVELLASNAAPNAIMTAAVNTSAWDAKKRKDADNDAGNTDQEQRRHPAPASADPYLRHRFNVRELAEYRATLDEECSAEHDR